MSSNQSTTITYFKGWGLAEQVRWLLASHPSTSDFSSFCLSNFEEFDALRTSGDLLFGQLPLLEIDGMKLVQSQACVRYVARRNGMAGKDQAEQARADMVVELIKDARLGVVKWPFSKDKSAHVNEVVYPCVHRWLPVLERVLLQGGGYIGSEEELNYADVLIAEMLQAYGEMFESLPGGSFDDVFESEGGFGPFIHLRKVHSVVVSKACLKAYLESDRRWSFPAEGPTCDRYVENVTTVLGRNK